MHLNWSARPKTRRVWWPSRRAGLRRRAPWTCPDYSGLPGGQGDPAGSAGVGGIHPHRYQVARALCIVGAEGTTGPVAAGQAGPVRHFVSQSGAGPAGGGTAARHVLLGRPGGGGEKLDASVHAVWRVLRREGIYLQRRRSWCVSTDKGFAPKAAEVVGLYLNPPLNAVVLSVDEKPSIQAIETGMRLCGDRQR
jgi:hypothetical protein